MVKTTPGYGHESTRRDHPPPARYRRGRKRTVPFVGRPCHHAAAPRNTIGRPAVLGPPSSVTRRIPSTRRCHRERDSKCTRDHRTGLDERPILQALRVLSRHRDKRVACRRSPAVNTFSGKLCNTGLFRHRSASAASGDALHEIVAIAMNRKPRGACPQTIASVGHRSSFDYLPLVVFRPGPWRFRDDSQVRLSSRASTTRLPAARAPRRASSLGTEESDDLVLAYASISRKAFRSRGARDPRAPMRFAI